MTRFAGEIGYGVQQEIPAHSGKWKAVITERKLFGEVSRNTKQNVQGPTLNDVITVSNTIRVVADAFATANFYNIRYVKWNGVRWTVSNVDVQPPALVLTLGEVYHGPIPA